MTKAHENNLSKRPGKKKSFEKNPKKQISHEIEPM
jgi:hypothetical protein